MVSCWVGMLITDWVPFWMYGRGIDVGNEGINVWGRGWGLMIVVSLDINNDKDRSGKHTRFLAMRRVKEDALFG